MERPCIRGCSACIRVNPRLDDKELSLGDDVDAGRIERPGRIRRLSEPGNSRHIGNYCLPSNLPA